jgi:hypothetical protein
MAGSSTTSRWQQMSARREAFFARNEGKFLWLLGIPLFVAGVSMLLHYMSWTAGMGGLLESFLVRIRP